MLLGLICYFVRSCWNQHWTISFCTFSQILDLSRPCRRRTGTPIWAKVNNNNHYHHIFFFSGINPLAPDIRGRTLDSRTEFLFCDVCKSIRIGAWVPAVMCLPLSPADPHGSQGSTRSFHVVLESLSPPFPANSWSTETNSIPQTLFQNFCKRRNISSVTFWSWCKRNFTRLPRQEQWETRFESQAERAFGLFPWHCRCCSFSSSWTKWQPWLGWTPPLLHPAHSSLHTGVENPQERLHILP